MPKKLLFCLLILTTSSHISLAFLNTLVRTPSGPIEGKVQFYNGMPIGAFLGIPFAKPPIGELRFKSPEPIEPWDKTLEAKEVRPGCVQYTRNPFPWKDNLPGITEDCLYLNVWAPMTSTVLSRKSVMFWIYGGAFIFGSNRVNFYDGLVLAAEGDVVVVTINYRVGPFGFLYSGTEDAPGNMGLLDMVEALKWVRNNIESFGGDRNSITLFGQSAGGIATGMFCVSPLTRGLFKRVIMQSGSPANLDGEDNDRDGRITRKLAEAFGCADERNTLRNNATAVMKCLRDVDAFELAQSLSNVSRCRDFRYVYPRFGDKLLPKNPRQSIIDGDFAEVDVLIGTNSGDGALLITTSMTDVFGFFGEKNPQINLTFGESIIRKQFYAFPDREAVVKQYLSGIREDDYDAIREKVFMATGDYERTCPATYFAETFARRDVLTYYYFFIHRPSNSPFAPWMLASHFDETPFVFGYPLRYRRNYTAGERRLSRRMIQAWSSFAKTGVPTGGVWPPYSKENPRYQILDVTSLGTGTGPRQNNCNFFRPYFGF